MSKKNMRGRRGEEVFTTLHYNFLYEEAKEEGENYIQTGHYTYSHNGIRKYLKILYPKHIYKRDHGFMYDITDTPLWQDMYSTGWDDFKKNRKRVEEQDVRKAIANHNKYAK